MQPPPPIRLTPVIWTRLGAAVLLGAGLGGCAPATPPPAPAPTATPGQAGEVGEQAVGEGGGEAGEVGAASALSGLSPADAAQFNRWRLFGFVAIAGAELADRNYPEASALIGQGMLEVFPTPPAGLDLAALNALDAELAASAPKADAGARLTAAGKALVAGAPSTPDTVRRLVELAVGLYQEADKGAEGVDPLEYQHSLGAALAAQQALAALKAASKNPGAFAKAETELNRLRALYAPVRAGDKITPYKDMLAQASRVELELAGVR
jgi:hypothetical protein